MMNGQDGAKPGTAALAVHHLGKRFGARVAFGDATRDVHELIDGLRQRGATTFLTTRRLEEAGRPCDRVAILNITQHAFGRPGELMGVRASAAAGSPDVRAGRLQARAGRGGVPWLSSAGAAR